MTVAVIFELTPAPGRKLRVAQVLRDYTQKERAEAPKDSRKVHG
jgi:hypothetical protein